MLNILVVEDNIYKYENIKRYLEVNGEDNITHVEARNTALGLLAKSQKSESKYDLMIVDIQMPIYNCTSKIDRNAGYLIISEMCRRELDIPFVVCSSEAEEAKHRLEELKTFTNEISELCIGYVEYDSSCDYTADFKEIIQRAKEIKQR